MQWQNDKSDIQNHKYESMKIPTQAEKKKLEIIWAVDKLFLKENKILS